ncbi:MAG TPA: VC0807 family protein, partial [Mycobacteriales bacterium]|nr:VC0807 family protein [Mycobacteriales bacterium]
MPESTSPAGSDTAPADHRPDLRGILRHLGLSLLWANVIPGALFYVTFRLGNVWAALIVALAWCYGVMAWRLATRRRTSGLLWITALGLTVKTTITLATGDTFLYFAQPAVNDAAVGLMFLASLTSARPVVARLAHDFFPMSEEIASRPAIKQLFWRLTIFWAVVSVIKSITTFYLLESTSLATFVAVKSVLTPTIAGIAAGVTITVAFRAARSEGLLHRVTEPVA